MFFNRSVSGGVVATALVALLSLSGCSGGELPGGNDPSAQESAIDFTQTGPITYVQGKDNTGNLRSEIDQWNKENPDQVVTMIELPESADQQRNAMVQNASTKSDQYTVVGIDVVWTAEFAARGYIAPLPKEKLDLTDLLPATLDSATYFDQLYGMPVTTNGGLLFYRTDWLQKAGIEAPPKTFAEMKQTCDTIKQKVPEASGASCYGGQFNKYEGLTVNVAEAVDSAGGALVDNAGKATANSAESVKGLDALVGMFKDGTIPKEAKTWKEEESRVAFQSQKLIFMRNWPYVFPLANDENSAVKGKFAVAALPGVDGPGVSSLGGRHYSISSFGKNKGTALAFIKWMSEPERMVNRTKVTAEAATRGSVYLNPEVTAAYPFMPVLKQSVEGARARPKVVKYGEVTLAVQDATFAAIEEKQEPQAAFDGLQAKLEPLVKS